MSSHICYKCGGAGYLPHGFDCPACEGNGSIRPDCECCGRPAMWIESLGEYHYLCKPCFRESVRIAGLTWS